jgi:hypothetical protein
MIIFKKKTILKKISFLEIFQKKMKLERHKIYLYNCLTITRLAGDFYHKFCL